MKAGPGSKVVIRTEFFLQEINQTKLTYREMFFTILDAGNFSKINYLHTVYFSEK